jgi:hypothetical protein
MCQLMHYSKQQQGLQDMPAAAAAAAAVVCC